MGGWGFVGCRFGGWNGFFGGEIGGRGGREEGMGRRNGGWVIQCLFFKFLLGDFFVK